MAQQRAECAWCTPDGVAPLKGGLVSKPAEVWHEHVGGHEATQGVPGSEHILGILACIRLVRRDGDYGEVVGHVGCMPPVSYGKPT